MSEAPERISVYPLEGTWGYGGMEFAEGDEPGLVEYVRADRIEELKAVIDHQHKRAETLAEGWRIADDARIELEAKLADALNNKARAEDAELTLACLSSYLGAGLGDETTSAQDYYNRILWGIENNRKSLTKLAAQADVSKVAPQHTRTELIPAILDTGVADAIHEGIDRIEELEAQLAKALDALKSAARKYRVIAGMDMIGASATAYNAAREAEAAIAELEGGAK